MKTKPTVALLVFAILASVTLAIVSGSALIGRITPPCSAQEPKAKTLEQRVAALEKENMALRAHIESKFQRGNYRMSEIEAQMREVEGAAQERDERLARGKCRMDELQHRCTFLHDLVMKHHPEEKPGGKK